MSTARVGELPAVPGFHPGSWRGEYARDTRLGMGKLDPGILYFVWENWTGRGSAFASVNMLIYDVASHHILCFHWVW